MRRPAASRRTGPVGCVLWHVHMHRVTAAREQPQGVFDAAWRGQSGAKATYQAHRGAASAPDIVVNAPLIDSTCFDAAIGAVWGIWRVLCRLAPPALQGDCGKIAQSALTHRAGSVDRHGVEARAGQSSSIS